MNSVLFGTQSGIAILRHDRQECFDTNANFPKNDEMKKYYEIDHGNKVHGQRLVTVVFTIIADVRFKDIKGKTSVMDYLNKSFIWLREHRFDTTNITKIGYMSMSHPTFNYFEDYKPRMVQMIKNNMEGVDIEDSTIDAYLKKFKEGKKTIPEFEIVVSSVQFRKPDPAKGNQNTASNKKQASRARLTI